MKTSGEASADVLPGNITITRTSSGYYFIQIGRLKYTKRFNLSQTEAEALVDELGAVLNRS